jgi:hypothetical protein
MAHDVVDATRSASATALRSWGVVAGVLGCLVGIPALVLAEIEVGLLTAVGLGASTAFALVVMVPGFALGGLALVVMLGTP